MELKLELDYHQEPEKPSLENAEPQLVLLLEEEEPINQFSKQETYSININVRERCGQLLEVLSWIQLITHTEEVITNILVNQVPFQDSVHQVRRLV